MQVGRDLNSCWFWLVLFFFYFPTKVGRGHIHNGQGIPQPLMTARLRCCTLCLTFSFTENFNTVEHTCVMTSWEVDLQGWLQVFQLGAQYTHFTWINFYKQSKKEKSNCWCEKDMEKIKRIVSINIFSWQVLFFIFNERKR